MAHVPQLYLTILLFFFLIIVLFFPLPYTALRITLSRRPNLIQRLGVLEAAPPTMGSFVIPNDSPTFHNSIISIPKVPIPEACTPRTAKLMGSTVISFPHNINNNKI